MERLEKQTIINFDPVAHKYTDDNGLVYTSVTTLIDKYKPKFNNRYWSMYVALRDNGFKVRPVDGLKAIVVDGVIKSLDSLYNNPINNHEVKLVTKKWTKLTEDACARGNKIHDFLEDNINKSKGDEEGRTNELIKPSLSLGGNLLEIRTKHDLDATDIGVNYPQIYNRLLAFIKMGCTIFAEKRIYSTSYQVAGMIDVLVVKGRQFCILDWKTNKDEMIFQSGYFKKEHINGKYVKTDQFIRKLEYMHEPLNNVELCKGMVYSMQLSLYAYIMIRWGYKLVENGLEIWHIRPGLEPKCLKIRFMQDEVIKMLDHHYNNRIKNNSPNNIGLGIK